MGVDESYRWGMLYTHEERICKKCLRIGEQMSLR
jgi:hypothetical protein